MLKKELIQFFIIGMINTIVYYSLFSLFIYVEFDYKIAVFLATLIGVFFSYKTFGKFVFNHHDNKRIFRFILVYIILYFVNIFVVKMMYIFIENYYSAGLIATLVCAILSFILNKWFVFKKEKKENE